MRTFREYAHASYGWLLVTGCDDGRSHTLHSAEVRRHAQTVDCRCKPVIVNGIVNHRSWRPGAAFRPLERRH